DIVGIDTLIHVAKNCYDSLQSDREREVFQMPEFVRQLAEAGALGRKTGRGFYKKAGDSVLVLDLEQRDYRERRVPEFTSVAQSKSSPAQRIQKLVSADDQAAQFAWGVLAKTLLYSARLVGEIADDVVNI